MLTFGSLFSGIGGFDLGLQCAGMRCAWQVEKDQHCKRILARHWPDVPRFDNVEEFALDETTLPVRPDLICGGFPCQDLSVAGRRAGLAGKRSGLFWEFVRILRALAPQWVFIENVPGLLSSRSGRDFGTVLGALGQLGYGFAYRVLDAQWFGVPQRRRRVFIVGCLGNWRRAAEILFECESLPWDSPPRRKAGSGVTPLLEVGARTGGCPEKMQRDGIGVGSPSDPMFTLQSSKQHGVAYGLVAHTLRADGFDASEDGTGRGTPLVACTTGAGYWQDGFGTLRARSQESHEHLVFDTMQITSPGNYSEPKPGGPCHPLASGAHPPAVAFTSKDDGGDAAYDVSPTLRGGQHDKSHANAGVPPAVATGMTARRLTPRECERLMSFPDDWTRWNAEGVELKDGPRYRMLGNAVVVSIADWIGQQIIEASVGQRELFE